MTEFALKSQYHEEKIMKRRKYIIALRSKHGRDETLEHHGRYEVWLTI